MELVRILFRVTSMGVWVFVVYAIIVASIWAVPFLELFSGMLTREMHVPAVVLWSLWTATVAGVIFCGGKACEKFTELMFFGW